MKSVADVNVLFALLVSNHPHHTPAWNWWRAQTDDAVALCWMTRLGVLRLLTNSKVMNGSPLGNQEALNAWDALAQDPCTFWSDASDAWLAAHAESQGWRLTSFDADFRSFALTDFEHLQR